MDKNYYGVSQLNHGHEYRWIYEESVLSKNIYDNNSVPNEDNLDCSFPIGGSNSSSTWIKKLNDLSEIKDFLTAPAEGPDSEDPMLIDIAEYLLTISTEDNSCTEQFLKQLNLTTDNLEQTDDKYKHKENAIKIFNYLNSINYPNFDHNNPFYGNNKDMTYSELCDIYKQSTGEDI